MRISQMGGAKPSILSNWDHTVNVDTGTTGCGVHHIPSSYSKAGMRTAEVQITTELNSGLDIIKVRAVPAIGVLSNCRHRVKDSDKKQQHESVWGLEDLLRKGFGSYKATMFAF